MSLYFLRNGAGWLITPDLSSGPWAVAKSLPVEFTRLPHDDNWAEVRKHVPGKPAASVPQIFVSHTPGELILTDGKPSLTPIPGTGLLHVVNTDSDVFLHTGSGHFYYLAAGRWFRARTRSA